MYKYKMFLILFFYMLKAISGPVMFGLGVGYEDIHGLTSDQSSNILTRAYLSKEISMMNIVKSDTLYLGFEVAARNGFSGALDLSEEIQDEIGGPTPILLSSPEVELLVTIRAGTGITMPYLLTKFGFDVSVLNFDRADLMSTTVNNILAFVGLGLKLSERYDLHILASGSRPLSKLHFNEFYSIDNPYTQKEFLIEFVKAF